MKGKEKIDNEKTLDEMLQAILDYRAHMAEMMWKIESLKEKILGAEQDKAEAVKKSDMKKYDEIEADTEEAKKELVKLTREYTEIQNDNKTDWAIEAAVKAWAEYCVDVDRHITEKLIVIDRLVGEFKKEVISTLELQRLAVLKRNKTESVTGISRDELRALPLLNDERFLHFIKAMAEATKNKLIIPGCRRVLNGEAIEYDDYQREGRIQKDIFNFALENSRSYPGK